MKAWASMTPSWNAGLRTSSYAHIAAAGKMRAGR
nr:MAG TPA: hypothetical protein [Caudoviricetes sp.]